MEQVQPRAEDVPQPSTEAEIIEFTEKLKALLLRKNKAYGDSAMNPMRVFSKADPKTMIEVRIDDKLSRLLRGHKLEDESFDQTIEDLLGYLVLLQIARRRAKNEQSQQPQTWGGAP